MRSVITKTVIAALAICALGPVSNLEAGALALKKKVVKIAPVKKKPAPKVAPKVAPAPAPAPAPVVKPKAKLVKKAILLRRRKAREHKNVSADNKTASDRAENRAAKAADRKRSEARSQMANSARRMQQAREKVASKANSRRVNSILKRLRR